MISLSGSNMAQFVIIALNLTIVTVTLKVFGKQFNVRYNEEIQEICLNKEKYGMTEVYRDNRSIDVSDIGKVES